MASLRLDDVGKRYPGGPWVLHQVEMELPEGGSVSVLGSNGSGKSTLLRLLAGVSRPTRGRITGYPPIIGYVPDRFPASDAMGSLAYLVHVGRIRGLGTAAARRRGQDLLERLDLVGGIRTPIRALSKGNAQKVALGQALMVAPGLLVLDEPWSGLDATAHEVLAAVIGEVAGDGGTVVFTDHREAVSSAYASMSYRIEAGRVQSVRVAGARDRVPLVSVVLTDPGRARRVDWPAVDGVAACAGEDGQIRIRVRADAADDLLLSALRDGWSVAEVRRGPAGREAGTWSR
ncbi:ATP-binding cassette domain-containing protein [Actinoplanes sp. NPDC051494]|uniref:ATP-binding cassette domain-containing protein n=1 Tax=Actinoplanes sp. NPDC051494 TaxID=3363907 RepID=UPI0037ADD050